MAEDRIAKAILAMGILNIVTNSGESLTDYEGRVNQAKNHAILEKTARMTEFLYVSLFPHVEQPQASGDERSEEVLPAANW